VTSNIALAQLLLVVAIGLALVAAMVGE